MTRTKNSPAVDWVLVISGAVVALSGAWSLILDTSVPEWLHWAMILAGAAMVAAAARRLLRDRRAQVE